MKFLIKLAFKNIMRNKRRTFLSALSICVAIMTIVFAQGYIEGMKISMFNNVIISETGHIRITTKEYKRREIFFPVDENINGFNNQVGYIELINAIKKVDGIVSIQPRIRFKVMLVNKKKKVYAVGYGIDINNDFIRLKDNINTGKAFDNNFEEAVLGYMLAKDLDIDVKKENKIPIITTSSLNSTQGIEVRIKGTSSYGAVILDKKAFFIPLKLAQELLQMENQVTELLIEITDKNNAPKIALEIEKVLKKYDKEGKYETSPWQNTYLLGFFEMAGGIYFIIYIIIAGLACFVIGNTMMMVVHERIKEIGTINALGMKKRNITSLFFSEALIISSIGSLAGVILGYILTYIFGIVGINVASASKSLDMPISNIIRPVADFIGLLYSFLIGIIIASIIVIFPSRRAAKLDPIEALRTI